ncbi:MAG: Ig-like domain-containing protein [Gemmatimonadota bacterium]|nr:Ig-like domain-containing protein [Gemmatimonadota bacterium]MDH3423966.1 Ig-like domain-containing protein [Gemmatimonadota bacterium]
MIRRVNLIGVALSVLLLGCGGEDPVRPKTVASVSVVSTTSTLYSMGETAQLTVSATYTDGSIATGVSYTWSSSDEAVLMVSASGLVTAAGENGSAEITAMTGGVSGSLAMEVVTGPEGGTVLAAGGLVKLVVPPGAVSGEIQLTVQEATSSPGSSFFVDGTAYEFGPDGTEFSVPIEITIGYDRASLPNTLEEGFLRVYKVTPADTWEAVGGEVNRADQTVTAEVTSFSQYALLAPPDPAIANTSIPLVLQAETTYRDIQFYGVDDPCTITRDREPILDIWISRSRCSNSFDGDGIMRPSVYAWVSDFSEQLVPPFHETVTTRPALARNFSVGGPEGETYSATVNLQTKFLARLFASTLGAASYKINFSLYDATAGSMRIDEDIDQRSKSGGFKVVAVQGVPVPVPIPEWEKAEVPYEVLVRNVPLTAGHEYLAVLRITMSATNTWLPLWFSQATFREPLGPFTEPGFFQLEDMTIEVIN